MEASARLRLVDQSASDAPTSGSIAVLQFFETPFSSEELGLHFHYNNIILDVMYRCVVSILGCQCQCTDTRPSADYFRLTVNSASIIEIRWVLSALSHSRSYVDPWNPCFMMTASTQSANEFRNLRLIILQTILVMACFVVNLQGGPTICISAVDGI
jgi:hypothetical protein